MLHMGALGLSAVTDLVLQLGSCTSPVHFG